MYRQVKQRKPLVYFLEIEDIEERMIAFTKYLFGFKYLITLKHIDNIALIYPEQFLGFEYVEDLKKFFIESNGTELKIKKN